MPPPNLTVWHNVPSQLAQASGDSSVFDSVTSALGKQAEQGVQKAVKEYLDGKGDARLADLVGRVKFVVTFAGGALTLYLLSKSGGRR